MATPLWILTGYTRSGYEAGLKCAPGEEPVLGRNCWGETNEEELKAWRTGYAEGKRVRLANLRAQREASHAR